MAKVELLHLEKKYGSTTAAKDVHFTINDGEIVALLGPSGCGKTTTLRCIAGFEALNSGEIKIDGQLVNDLPPEKRNIGMVFQNYALFPHMTVLENIAYGLKIRKLSAEEIKKKVRDILKVVGLEGYELRYPSQLSGGQQQRTAIARALVINPRLLLLDEPLANLDAKLREEMRFYLKSLQREIGVTTIYVTHDQSEALALADKIVIMFNGKVHQIGTPTEIYKNPKTHKVVKFIGLANFIQGRVAASDEHTVQVDTSFGRIICEAQGIIPKAGADVSLAIRPENLSIAAAGSAAAGFGIDATVADKAYLGNIIHYFVTTSEGDSLRIETNSMHDYAKDAKVYVSFAESSVWLVPDEGEETDA